MFETQKIVNLGNGTNKKHNTIGETIKPNVENTADI